jgi:hypothetical protein
LEPGIDINYPYRTVDFHGSTSNVIVIYMPKNGCLRVLDPARGDEVIYAKLPQALTKAIPLSHPARIVTETDTPAAPPFIAEPAHAWCYYFAKAELARQNGNFEQVVSLGNEAISSGFKPEDQNEWLIFIEAYALTGDLKTAEELSIAVLAEDARMRRGLCTVWKQVQAKGAALSPTKNPIESEGLIESIILSFNCSP